MITGDIQIVLFVELMADVQVHIIKRSLTVFDIHLGKNCSSQFA